MNWFLGILLTLVITWIFIRLFTWLVSWLLWRFFKVNLKVGSVGILTLGRVHIRLRDKLTLELEKIWLSSSYVNNEIKKPVCVCFGDVRLQVVLPEETGEGIQQKPAAEARVSNLLQKLLSALQFVGLQLENMRIIILKDSLQDSMINLIFNEMKLDWTLQQTSLNLSASAEQFTSKVLRKQSQDSEVQPCLAELSLCVSFSMLLDVSNLVPPEIVRLKINHVQAMITEGLVLQIQKMRRAAMQNELTASPRPVEDSVLSRPPKIFSLLPKEASIEIENVSAVLIRETAKRTLSATVRQTTLHLLQGPNILNNCRCDILLEDFQAKSPQANISSMNKFTASLDIKENSVIIDTKIVSSFLGYHHEEIHYWLAVFSRLRAERGTKPKTLSQTNKESAIVQSLKEKTIRLCCNIQESSMAIAMVSCSGVKGGLSEAKVNVTVMPAHKDCAPDLRAEIEVTALYSKLTDGGAPSAELTTKVHHWNTICSVGIVLCKVNKMGKEIHFESMIDCVQLESSTTICSVIAQLVTVIQKTIPPISPTLNEQSHIANQTGAGDSGHEYANDRTIHKKRGRLKDLAENAVFNVKVTSVNIFATNDLKACVMLRLDSLSVDHKAESVTNIEFSGAKVVYFLCFDRRHNIQRSIDMLHYNGHLQTANIAIDIKSQSVIVTISEELSFRWTTAFHMAAYQAIQDVGELGHRLQVNKSGGRGMPHTKPVSSQSKVSISVTISANMFIILQLSKGHRVTLGSPYCTLTLQSGQISWKSEELAITFDQHDIFKVLGIHVYSQHHCAAMKLTREALGYLSLPTNRCFLISLQSLAIVFPYNYDFAACLEEVINLNKWRKLVHKKEKKPFTVDTPLPADIVIQAKNVQVQWNDDPIEMKLWNNYELMVDEYHESEKRRLAMDKRIAELRKQYGLLPDGKIQELYNQLSKKSAEVYMQRTRQIYTNSECRMKLFTWRMETLDITALADTSFHGKDNVLKHMTDIDPDSPFPEDNMEFSTLFCRHIALDLTSLTIQLRDFPQLMLDISNMHVWGRFIGAEQEAPDRAKRACIVEVAQPWGDVTVYRNMTPLKFFHDFSSDISSWTQAYGSVWEPTVAEFNLAMNLINKPSLDPSIPPPFWDKFRLILHGRLTMSVDKMTWLYHASFDPYNTTELMDWTWTNLVLDWTNAKWVLKGDLDISSKTASKYDDCRLLHLPCLRFCARLDWICLGDPNDHHSVMPCAPDKVPDYSVQEHDSFRSFRSQCLNLNVSFETKPSLSGDDDVPTCVFYSNTLKWMDKVRNCMDRVSRPIRRGKFFQNLIPRKPILSRHYRDIHLSVNFHQFQVCYWVSFAKQHGMEMRGDAFQLSVGPQLNLVPVDDGLYHRKQAKWTIQHFKSELNNATIWLCSSKQPDPSQEHGLLPMPVKSFFLNVKKKKVPTATLR